MTAKPRPRVPHWHHVDTTAALGETMDLVTADHIRQRLELQPHPEGGWYAETFRSDMDIDVVQMGADAKRARPSTSCWSAETSAPGMTFSPTRSGTTMRALRWNCTPWAPAVTPKFNWVRIWRLDSGHRP